jgi:uncharacterized protein YyaL (SSP411 family)
MSRNQLDRETSPYLLLHKDNPVHWYTWGPEAFAEAEASGKPILLSVGYTACHWCHVMNHESFADPATAAVMNDLYVNIKVDREERPDIDQIYQAAANSLGHSGGWPLTMFLTSKGEPYFAAAYLPNEERFGQPAFKTVLTRCAEIYKSQPDAVANTNARVQDTYNKLWNRDLSGVFDAATFDSIAIHIGQRFDAFYGGMTGAPKFPTTGLVELLWRGYLRTSVPQFQQLVLTTLSYMSMSGIYDHVGGGFHRYALDETWMVPHFEKMLYDNAQMIDILTTVWQSERLTLYRDRIEETVAWVLREMMVDHAFASSIDADSEGEEGKYYLWSEAEIDAALVGTYLQKFKDTFNVRREGNYQNGLNILHRVGVASGFSMPEADAALLKRQRDLLLAARQKRSAPMRDDKVLADWNGMMIAALANAGAVFKKLDWTAAAIRAFDFIVKVLGDNDRLCHSWRDGKRQHTGFADDYAHMARAALALWESTGDKNYLSYAQRWVHVLNEHFWDVQNGGYFYTSDDSDPLIVRSRMVFDQSMACANGTMVTVLGKLYSATADNSYRERTNALIQAFAGEINRVYLSMGSFLNGVEFVLAGVQIVIVGHVSNPKTHQLIDAVLGRSLPNKMLLLVDPNETLPEGHPAFGKTMQNGQPTAYLCQRNICSAPFTNPVQLSQILLLPARVADQQMQAQRQSVMQPIGRA